MRNTDIQTIRLCRLCMKPLSMDTEVSTGYFAACSNCDEDLFEFETITECRKLECKNEL